MQRLQDCAPSVFCRSCTGLQYSSSWDLIETQARRGRPMACVAPSQPACVHNNSALSNPRLSIAARAPAVASRQATRHAQQRLITACSLPINQSEQSPGSRKVGVQAATTTATAAEQNDVALSSETVKHQLHTPAVNNNSNGVAQTKTAHDGSTNISSPSILSSSAATILPPGKSIALFFKWFVQYTRLHFIFCSSTQFA
jgi:hypothetical protein